MLIHHGEHGGHGEIHEPRMNADDTDQTGDLSVCIYPRHPRSSAAKKLFCSVFSVLSVVKKINVRIERRRTR